MASAPLFCCICIKRFSFGYLASTLPQKARTSQLLASEHCDRQSGANVSGIENSGGAG